jgi:hypothetical protein
VRWGRHTFADATALPPLQVDVTLYDAREHRLPRWVIHGASRRPAWQEQLVLSAANAAFRRGIQRRCKRPATRLGDEALPRARGFLRTTTFEPMSAQPLGAFATAFEQFEETLTDEDGEARRDWKREDSEIDPSDLILEEVVLPVDVEASVHGPWSASEGAIVAPGTLLAATHVVAVLGPPKEKLDKLEVEHSTTTYVITATVLLALGAGLIWFGNIFPSLQ